MMSRLPSAVIPPFHQSKPLKTSLIFSFRWRQYKWKVKTKTKKSTVPARECAIVYIYNSVALVPISTKYNARRNVTD